jgi:hypothetical protein
MQRSAQLMVLLVFSGVAVMAAGGASADDAMKMKKPPSDQQLIASAMSAAPAAVTKGATIVAMGEDGKLRTLKKGTNQFTCMPDDPNTPGTDPMCADRNAMEHLQAMMDKKPPPTGKVGLMYMLLGGVDASNTDPYATRPEAGKAWIRTGPHVMIIGADQSFYDQYPKDASPNTAVPYVMWGGTPYQHLMAPVK